jgi:tight adherence protein B
MVTFAPIAIFIGATAAAALALYSFWDGLQRGAADIFRRSAGVLDRAGVRRKAEDSAVTWLVLSAALWILLMIFLRPSLVLGLLLLPASALAAAGLYAAYVRLCLRKRTEAFINQLEVVLRLMASGLRSGLGLQQSLSLVIDECQDPARHEFSRVIGQANIGVSVYDALDDLADRIPRNETKMMSRVIRIQSQTGGDLAKVLEQLANTIKERRRMQRKIKSLTAEGRTGALVLSALPVVLGFFIVSTQHGMGHALIATSVGHTTLMIVAVLEVLGVFTLLQILKVNV